MPREPRFRQSLERIRRLKDRLPYTGHMWEVAARRRAAEVAGTVKGARFPPGLKELVVEHERLKQEIRGFKGQLGAAPEIYFGKYRFPDQTTTVGQQVISHAKSLVSAVYGVDPRHITSYLASGTGVGEVPASLSSIYHKHVGGRPYVIEFGPFSNRISMQYRRHGVQPEPVEIQYGRQPAARDVVEEFERRLEARGLERGLKHGSGVSDTITFPHLETGTAVELDAEAVIEGIHKAFLQRRLEAPLFVVDTTSSKGVDMPRLNRQGIKVALFQATVKPITSQMQTGLIMTTEAGQKEMLGRDGALKKLREGNPSVELPPLYFDYAAESRAQEETGRSRFTQPVGVWHAISESLLDYLKQGAKWGKSRSVEEAVRHADEFMQAKRGIVQRFVIDSMRVLGLRQYAHSSTMLVSFKVPAWLRSVGPEKLLEAYGKEYGRGVHVGYAGANPSAWESAFGGVTSYRDILRYNTYRVNSVPDAVRDGYLLAKTVLRLMRRKGIEVPGHAAEDIEFFRMQAFREFNRLKRRGPSFSP